MQIEQIARELKSGNVVGLPTETVFGLACSLHSHSAIEKLMRLKDRDINSGKVFTLVPESVKNAEKYVIFTKNTRKIARENLPGALTLILPKNPTFSHPYFDHFDKIGIRIPDFPLFETLLLKSGPLLLTSANLRGQKPVKTAAELTKTMPEVDYVIDLPAGNQPPSTIIDFTSDLPTILRQGAFRLSH